MSRRSVQEAFRNVDVCALLYNVCRVWRSIYFQEQPVMRCMTIAPMDLPSAMKPHLLPYQHVFQTLLGSEGDGAEKSKSISVLIRVEDFFNHGGTHSPSKKEVMDLCSSFLRALNHS